METNNKKKNDEIQPVVEEEKPSSPEQENNNSGGGGWGWGGFSAFSVLSDLQKAAEDISRNAAEVAKTAANSMADLQNELEDSASSKEDKSEVSDKDQESEDEDDKKRKAALEKLENASDDTFLGQGLKAIDTSVENFATGAWQAFGNAWKGGSTFVQKLENSIQQGGIPAAGSDILETGRAFTAKGIQVLEYVGKETVDLLITESGMEVDKNAGEGGHETEEDQLLEEVTFDRCFYIYGGPEQLEELEALSNHYAMLFNRRKAKLSTEEKTAYDAKLKEVQQMLNLDTASESEKGKNVENASDSTDDEIKSFHTSSVSKAAQMAAGFANALAGLSASDIVQKTGGRLDSLHSEGVHRLSEMCCIAVSQLLILGKSVIQNANKSQDADEDEDIVKIDWPEDSIDKAKTIRMKTQSMTGYLEEVAISFVTGISDVAEAYAAAIKSAAADSPDVKPQKSVQDKVKSFSEDLRVNRTTAVGKIQELEHRPKLAIIEAQGIPQIDLSPLVNLSPADYNNATAIQGLVDQVHDACKNWGFFQVINHGVPIEICEQLMSVAKKFFDQPVEEKRKVMRNEANPLGYCDTEVTKTVREWKEVFDFTAGVPMVMPTEGDQTVEYANQWPNHPSELRVACEEYVNAVQKLSNKLLKLISMSLNLSPNRLEPFFKDQTAFVRLNHYPTCLAPNLALGAGRHKDAGALTILAQDDVGGLEVKRKTDGEWIFVKPVHNSFIINLGDVMQVWSNDIYESIEHRVRVNSTRERFSIPFFMNPALYIVVEPLPELISEENPAKYKGYHWGKFLATQKQ